MNTDTQLSDVPPQFPDDRQWPNDATVAEYGTPPFTGTAPLTDAWKNAAAPVIAKLKESQCSPDAAS